MGAFGRRQNADQHGDLSRCKQIRGRRFRAPITPQLLNFSTPKRLTCHVVVSTETEALAKEDQSSERLNISTSTRMSALALVKASPGFLCKDIAFVSGCERSPTRPLLEFGPSDGH